MLTPLQNTSTYLDNYLLLFCYFVINCTSKVVIHYLMYFFSSCSNPPSFFVLQVLKCRGKKSPSLNIGGRGRTISPPWNSKLSSASTKKTPWRTRGESTGRHPRLLLNPRKRSAGQDWRRKRKREKKLCRRDWGCWVKTGRTPFSAAGGCCHRHVSVFG